MKEKKTKGRGGQRLVRLVLLGLVGFLVLMMVKNLAAQGASFSLPSLSWQRFIPEKILDSTSELILGEKAQLAQPDQAEEETSTEVEPIAQPVEKIQSQTQFLLDLIKKLPEDQIRAVKKQLCKEICEDYQPTPAPPEE